MEKEMAKGKGHPAWKMLVAACLLVGGGQGLIFNIFGIFMSAICQENGYSTGMFGTVISVGALGLLIVLGMTGKLMRKFKLRPLLVTLIIITCVSYFALAFCHSIPLFYVLFFLTEACGAIPAMVTGPMLVGNWFEAKKGMCMGIMLSIGCLFGIIGNIGGGMLIDAGGYSLAYMVIGPTSFILMLIGALMAVADPRMMGLKPYGAKDEPQAKTDSTGAAAQTEAVGIPVGSALKSLAFVALFAVIFILVWAGSFQTLIASFATSKGFSTAQGGTLTSVMQVGALVGSFIVGILDDKIGGRNTTILCLVLIVIASIAVIISGSTLGALYGSFILLGFAASSSGVQTPILTGKIFGQKDYTAIFSKIQMAQMLGGMFAVPIYGGVADATGSYNAVLILIAILAVLGILFTFIAIGSGKKLWKKTVGTEATD